MARDPYIFRRSWTLTVWSCLGALAVMTLLFVVIYQTRGGDPADRAALEARQVQAVAAMDQAQAAADARQAAARAEQEKLLY
ncbi:hypothetical protein [Brevundimonas sp.]|jgi:hypothetical protein|uniref:hypothetical protein n=1 Tax=Brevundimonas sp. TaxID=1871086 RepID=UPI0025C21BA0|nr:hypothetical protein [Brevundimonas sp.]